MHMLYKEGIQTAVWLYFLEAFHWTSLSDKQELSWMRRKEGAAETFPIPFAFLDRGQAWRQPCAVLGCMHSQETAFVVAGARSCCTSAVRGDKRIKSQPHAFLHGCWRRCGYLGEQGRGVPCSLTRVVPFSKLCLSVMLSSQGWIPSTTS